MNYPTSVATDEKDPIQKIANTLAFNPEGNIQELSMMSPADQESVLHRIQLIHRPAVKEVRALLVEIGVAKAQNQLPDLPSRNKANLAALHNPASLEIQRGMEA